MWTTRVLAVALLLGATAGSASAQSSTTLRERLIGTWSQVISEVTSPDGKKSFPFGETPNGILIFTPTGHFAQIHIASDVPRFASGNRLTGTPDEYKAINQKSLSIFGTYTVDEEKKTVTFKITSSTFPNIAGESQTRAIETLTADEFKNSTTVAGGRGSAFNFYKRAK
jgi:lipocalin-like protein